MARRDLAVEVFRARAVREVNVDLLTALLSNPIKCRE
jgi:hypothetical protein